MLTYNDFIRIRRSEQEDSRVITDLTDKLIEDMKDYIALSKSVLEEAKKNRDDKRVEEVSAQTKNVVNSLTQIINFRLIKFAQVAIFGSPIEQMRQKMSSSELIFFDSLQNLINEHKKRVIGEITDVTPRAPVMQEQPDEESADKVVVKIITNVPRFVWKNDKSYGPFSFPSVVELDRDVADILIRSGKAQSA